MKEQELRKKNFTNDVNVEESISRHQHIFPRKDIVFSNARFVNMF